MKRYITLCIIFCRASLKRAMMYPPVFFATMGTSLYWFMLALVGISVVTYQAPEVGGWNRNDLFVVQGVYSLIFGIIWGLVEANLTLLAEEVWQGNFDFKLLKPVDSQFLASFGYVKYHQIGRISAGVLLIVYALYGSGIPVDAVQLVGFFLFSLAGISIAYSLWLLLSVVCFWSPHIFNLSEAIGNIMSLTRYPLVIFRHISEALLYVLFPLVLITSVPAQVLTRKFDLSLGIWSVIVAVALLLAVRKIWFYALTCYTSTS